ncbi:MAG: TetR/AcrR family transcriptional regulator [Syntrophales bacterium]
MQKKELLELRKTPSQARSRKTMAEIYKAAAHVFISNGYANATTEQIAEKAGVSIGTLYHYFYDKETILFGLWEQYMNEVKTITEKVTQDIRLQGFVDRSIIPIILHIGLELISHDQLQNRLFISQIGLPETIIQKRRELGLYIESTMEAIFNEFANVRIRNTQIGAHIIWATVQAVVLDYVLSVSEEIESERLIDELSDMMGRYVFC